MHLVTGALFLHVGLALNGRNRAYGLVGLGLFYLVSGLLSFLTARPVRALRRTHLGLDQLAHVLLGLAAIVIGWMGRGVERRVYGRAVSGPARD